MNSVNFQSRLRRNFSGSVNFQAVFSSDSVNVAGPLSKTATKSMSQPILLNKIKNCIFKLIFVPPFASKISEEESRKSFK